MVTEIVCLVSRCPLMNGTCEYKTKKHILRENTIDWETFALETFCVTN